MRSIISTVCGSESSTGPLSTTMAFATAVLIAATVTPMVCGFTPTNRRTFTTTTTTTTTNTKAQQSALTILEGSLFDEDPSDTVPSIAPPPLSSPPIDTTDDAVQRAPLKYVGPYPCLALRFPELATPSQREKEEKGVSLDFVLDTGANTNTINGQVAQQLELEVVGAALPGISAQGALAGGADTFLLGDAQLEGATGLEDDKDALFITNLTASALPVANPMAAGLLSLAFFYTFPGGVEFTWGAVDPKDGKTVTTPPSIAFLLDDPPMLSETQRVQITSLPITNLPTVTIRINGVSMPALLDTGSPITVMNAQAAKAANVKAVGGSGSSSPTEEKSNNPFSAAMNKIKAAQAQAQAQASGDVLTIQDSNGKRIELRKTLEKVHVALEGGSSGNETDGNSSISDSTGEEDTTDVVVDFGKGQIYVGDIPGLAAMNAIGVDAPPAVILGMDVLRIKPKMLFRAQQNELYFP